MTASAAIIGTGVAPITRNAPRHTHDIALDACRRAAADAGVDLEEIDGLATYPGRPVYEPDGATIGAMLPLLCRTRNVRWYAELSDGLVGSAVIQAVDAVTTGRCRYALVWRALNQPRYGPWHHLDWAGRDQFLGPYGYYRVIHDHAMAFTRYCALSSCSRADTAQLAMAQRRNAALNPVAFFRDVALTLDDYLAAPMVSDPLCRFDCDIPVQGGWAAVVAAADAPRRSAHPPAYVRATAQQTSVMIGESLIYTLADHVDVGGTVCDALYRASGLGPDDIQVAQLYDGFSSSVYYWLEAAGFCGRGEGPAHLARMIEKHPDLLPVNTNGGSLSEGRSHGMGHIVEAARQVSGTVEPTRQVAAAEAAIVFTGAPTYHSAGLILSRSPGR